MSCLDVANLTRNPVVNTRGISNLVLSELLLFLPKFFIQVEKQVAFYLVLDRAISVQIKNHKKAKTPTIREFQAV